MQCCALRAIPSHHVALHSIACFLIIIAHVAVWIIPPHRNVANVRLPNNDLYCQECCIEKPKEWASLNPRCFDALWIKTPTDLGGLTCLQLIKSVGVCLSELNVGVFLNWQSMLSMLSAGLGEAFAWGACSIPIELILTQSIWLISFAFAVLTILTIVPPVLQCRSQSRSQKIYQSARIRKKKDNSVPSGFRWKFGNPTLQLKEKRQISDHFIPEHFRPVCLQSQF